MITVDYKDVAIGSKENCIVTCDDKKSYINLDNLNNDNTYIEQYGSCEPNRVLLNGTFNDLPVNPINQVYTSESMSNSEGLFEIPIVITRTFTGQYSAPGISFIFDNGTDNFWSDNLNVKWYRNDTLLFDNDYEPNSAYYFCEQNVEAFNKIEITFYSTSKSHRYLRIVNIEDGIDRQFTKEELKGVKVIEAISETGDNLGINSTEIDLISKDSVDYIFQKTQPIAVTYNNNLISKCFNASSTQSIGQKYNIDAEDYIGILDRETFVGGIYIDYPLSTLLSEIIGNIPFEYEGSDVVNGYLPIMSRRQALQYVAFATMKTIDCSRSNKIIIKDLPSVAYSIPDSRVIRYPTEDTESKVTKVILKEHKLKNRSGETELVNEAISGTATYLFDEPHRNYTITGGTLTASGANYAIITGTGANVVLKAYGFEDYITEISKDNPLTVSTDLPNVVEKSENRLITSANSNDVLNYISTVYFRNKKLSAKIIFGNECVGDLVTLSTGEKIVTGRITNLELDLITGIASIKILEV